MKITIDDGYNYRLETEDLITEFPFIIFNEHVEIGKSL